MMNCIDDSFGIVFSYLMHGLVFFPLEIEMDIFCRLFIGFQFYLPYEVETQLIGQLGQLSLFLTSLVLNLR